MVPNKPRMRRLISSPDHPSVQLPVKNERRIKLACETVEKDMK